MKKFILAFVAVFALSLVSCGGGNNQNADNGGNNQAVEQQAQNNAAKEQKAEEPKQEEQKADKQKADEQKADNAAQAQASGKDGKTIFLENGCTACHKPAEKSVGSALKDIAAKYNKDAGKLIKFLKGEADPIVDPAQFSVMKPNLKTTAKMADADLKALADYIFSAQ